MLARCCAALLAISTAACGARSELGGPSAQCTQLQIGIFGKPGAYAGGDFDQWLTGAGAAVERLQISDSEPVTAEALASFDVVVLDWLARDYSPPEAAAFGAWIAGGGGVIAMTGWDDDPTDDWHANSLMAPLGVAYSGPLLDGPIAELAPHPITGDLQTAVFKGGFAISDLGGAGTRTPIAHLATDAGEVTVGEAVELGNGRAFVWGDEWIEFLSQGTDFSPALWVQAFTWVAPRRRCVLTPPG